MGSGGEQRMKATTAKTAAGFRNILFATDFSPAAAQAVPYVKRMAKHYDADVVALYVRPPVVNPVMEPATWPIDIETAKAQDEFCRKELLDSFAGIRTKVLIEEGRINLCLKATMEAYHTDLVVIGTRGRTGATKLLLGSVAEEIFRTATCPVLTVGPHATMAGGITGPIREILYATDFSPESQHAADYAISMAQEFQSRLILLHVISKTKTGELVSATDLTTSSEQLLRKIVSPEAAVWCKPEYFVLHGDPAEQIIEFAKLREPDLVVLGVRPESGVPGAATHLPIATAHQVVSHVPCPVLTVRH
jgi:nucleotide-binding universal stress UspA family protein